MENGVFGVRGVNARLNVGMGNKPENVLVTAKNMVAPIAMVILPKQDTVPKSLVQVSHFYT